MGAVKVNSGTAGRAVGVNGDTAGKAVKVNYSAAGRQQGVGLATGKAAKVEDWLQAGAAKVGWLQAEAVEIGYNGSAVPASGSDSRSNVQSLIYQLVVRSQAYRRNHSVGWTVA